MPSTVLWTVGGIAVIAASYKAGYYVGSAVTYAVGTAYWKRREKKVFDDKHAS